jgi:hypothetical protein
LDSGDSILWRCYAKALFKVLDAADLAAVASCPADGSIEGQCVHEGDRWTLAGWAIRLVEADDLTSGLEAGGLRRAFVGATRDRR